MSMQEPYPKGPLGWPDRLELADTEADVVAVAREFLATVTPYEIARLPHDARPPKLTDAGDVSSYAFELVRRDIEQYGDSQRALQRLAAFFSRAATRLSRMMAPARPMGDAPDQARRL